MYLTEGEIQRRVEGLKPSENAPSRMYPSFYLNNFSTQKPHFNQTVRPEV